MQPGASAGLGFVTNGVTNTYFADSSTFPDDKGFYVGKATGNKTVYDLQYADVVCFRSSPTDADGYHSLIQDCEETLCDAAARDG